jgi:hypothetical protein
LSEALTLRSDLEMPSYRCQLVGSRLLALVKARCGERLTVSSKTMLELWVY